MSKLVCWPNAVKKEQFFRAAWIYTQISEPQLTSYTTGTLPSLLIMDSWHAGALWWPADTLLWVHSDRWLFPIWIYVSFLPLPILPPHLYSLCPANLGQTHASTWQMETSAIFTVFNSLSPVITCQPLWVLQCSWCHLLLEWVQSLVPLLLTFEDFASLSTVSLYLSFCRGPRVLDRVGLDNLAQKEAKDDQGSTGFTLLGLGVFVGFGLSSSLRGSKAPQNWCCI